MRPSFPRGCLCALALALAAAGRAQTLQADLSFPHALHQWDATGWSVDFGAVLEDRHFLGLEFTDFHQQFTAGFPVYGAAHVDERIDSLQLAYRYSFPLGVLWGGRPNGPLEAYLGAAGGLGRVRQALAATGAAPPAPQQETEFCAELAAGLQWQFGPFMGIKAGFRYIDSINNVRLFNADANTDTKTLEVGVVFRY
jgi:opacity protein-like surface antigen